MSAILTVQKVDKSFGPRQVLRGVSFAVHERDRIALVGVNGSGKSTLMRLIAAVAPGGLQAEEPGRGEGALGGDRADTTPDEGLITRRRDLEMIYVPQEPRLEPGSTVIESLRSGLRRHAEATARLAAIEAEIGSLTGAALESALETQAALHERLLDLGGFDPEHEIRGLAAALRMPPLEASVDRLSIGERRRVALGRALLGRPELLILDEPTNHLDARTVAWLEDRLTALPGALLLVTHDRYFLDRVATRILELDRGQLFSYEGGYRRFLEKQAERLHSESVRERERAAFVRRELVWIRSGTPARTTKQKARIDRFNDAVTAGERDPGELRTDESNLTLRLPMPQRLGKTILALRGVSKAIAGKQLYRDLTLVLKPGDRIGIVGENGAGKTTLLRSLLGQVQPDAGEIEIGVNTRFSFLDQGRAELDDTRSVLEEVAGDSEFVILPDERVHVRTFLRRMLFDDRFADARVGTLSGGERNRVQLAKLLRAGGNVILLDEPTNDLDLFTLGVLEEALVHFPGCALIVSHDRWFLDRVATGILAIEGNGQVRFFEGDYTAYAEKRRAEEEAAQKAALEAAPVAKAQAPAAAPAKAAASAKPRKRSFAEQKELAGMEAAILAAEEEVATLQGTLSDPGIYKDRSAEVPGLVARLDAAKLKVDALYARWQELEAISG